MEEDKELNFTEYRNYFFDGGLFFVALGFITAIIEPVIKGVNRYYNIQLSEKYSSSIFIDHMPTTTMSSLMLATTLLIFLSAILPKMEWITWGTSKALNITKRLIEYARVSVCIMLGIALFLPLYSIYTSNSFYFILSFLIVIVSFQFFIAPFMLHQLAHATRNTVNYRKRLLMVAVVTIVSGAILYVQALLG